MSPFSANISLKKSLVKTLSGTPILPIISKNEVTIDEEELLELKIDYKDLFQKLKDACQTIEMLKIEIRDKTEMVENISVYTNGSQNAAKLIKSNFTNNALEPKKLQRGYMQVYTYE